MKEASTKVGDLVRFWGGAPDSSINRMSITGYSSDEPYEIYRVLVREQELLFHCQEMEKIQ